MAYSDYGGYAYRNGIHIMERGDYTLTPDGGFESPGMWPGFTAVAQGATQEEALAIASAPTGHAVLGTGPIYVLLYKQYSISVYAGEHLLFRPFPIIHDGDWWRSDEKRDYKARIDFDKYRLEFRCTETDNMYIFAELTEPNGTVWTGFSGYGVGTGLEDADYGHSTDKVAQQLKEFYPDSFHPDFDPKNNPWAK